MYLSCFTQERNGWCVYKRSGELFMIFHAGPFSERAVAESEAKRLSDLEDVA